jgi:hypothetical protein
MPKSKTIDKLCTEYEEFDVDELIDRLNKIFGKNEICSENKRPPRRVRRAAHQKLKDLGAIESDDSINYHLNSVTGSDCSDSTVSSASSGSSENSYNQEQMYESMGLDHTSSMYEWLRFECYQHRIKNEKKENKTAAKKEARRRDIVAKKTSRKASEAKELHDAIKRASRDPVKNFSFLLQQVGFRYVYLHDEKKYAFVWINRNHGYDIVLFKGVSSPSKKVICNEIGQRAWQYLRSGKLEHVYYEISKFLTEKRNQTRDETETETSTFVQSLFASDADDADDEAE